MLFNNIEPFILRVLLLPEDRPRNGFLLDMILLTINCVNEGVYSYPIYGNKLHSIFASRYNDALKKRL